MVKNTSRDEFQTSKSAPQPSRAADKSGSDNIGTIITLDRCSIDFNRLLLFLLIYNINNSVGRVSYVCGGWSGIIRVRIHAGVGS